MAKERYFTGFESGQTGEFNTFTGGQLVGDATARTGDFYLSHYTPNGAGNLVSRALQNVYNAPGNGDTVRCRMQVAVLQDMFPTTITQQSFGFGTGVSGAPAQDIRVYLQPTGLFTVQHSASNSGPSASTSTPIQLGVWYVCRLDWTYQRNNAGADPYTFVLQVYLGSTMDDEVPTLVTSCQSSGSFALTDFTMIGAPSLGSQNSILRIAKYDDWWWSIASEGDVTTPDLNWPTGSRIQTVPITGQGSLAQWVGNYLLAREIPILTDAGNEQTATGAGLQTTFDHQTAAELGLIPIGQLATGGTPAEQAEAPPFTGGAPFDAYSIGAFSLFSHPVDSAIPVPTITSIVATAGAGSYNVGVFVRPFTIEWRSVTGGMQPVCSEFGASQFISAAQFPNFAANVTVAFHAATLQDRFLDPSSPGTSPYRRYGLGLLVSNAYANVAGSSLLDPVGPVFVTTNLLTYDSQPVLNNPFGNLVAMFSQLTPNGTSPPYAIENPQVRASSVEFRLRQPIQGGVSASLTSAPQAFTEIVQYVFAAPSQIDDADKPVVAALKVIAQARRVSGTANEHILIAGVDYPVSVNTGYGTPRVAFDWTERTAAEFDALEFGFETTSATEVRLGNILAEVMTAGPCTTKSPGQGQYQHQVGSFVANGTYQEIPVAFTDALGNPVAPSFVMVRKVRGGLGRPGCYRAWWMGGTIAASTTALFDPDSTAILLLQPGSFLVGPSIVANEAGGTYAFLAVYDGGQDTVNDAYFMTGSFLRQGTADPDKVVEIAVTDLFAASWIPDVVMVFGTQTVLKSRALVSPDSDAFNTTGLITTGVTALGDKTITTGTSTIVATLGQYGYFAYRYDAGGLLAQVFQDGSFAGTGGVLNIPTNFRGALIALDHPQVSYDGRFKSDAASTAGQSTPWGGGSEVANNITTINDASFDVGALASVVGQTSYWLAWKIDARLGNGGSSILPPPGGGGGGAGPPSDNICAGGGLKLTPGSANGNGCVQC